MAIVATVGSATANSYVTLAEALEYFAARPNADKWLAASDARQENALRWAASRLDDERWVGARADETQALSWPRNYVYKPHTATLIASDEIPQRVKDAQCEYALMVIESGVTNRASGAQNITSFSGGGVSVVRGGQGTSAAQQGFTAKSAVRQLIAPFVSPAGVYR